MKTPFLLFAFIGLGAFVGCRQDDDASLAASTSAPAETQPVATKAAPLPTAPMPRVKRKASEIIIGKWKLVHDRDPIPEKSMSTFIFEKDGKVVQLSSRKGWEPTVGTYRLDGDILTLSMSATTNDPAREYQGRIQSASESEVVLIGGPKDQNPGKSILRRSDGK